MKTRKEVNAYINSFRRPDNFNHAAWMTLKKWALAIWDAHLKNQRWQYAVKVSCKEFYQMLCDTDGMCIVPDIDLLKFEINDFTAKWFSQQVDLAANLAREGEFNEALAHLDIALKIKANSAEALNNKAVVLHQLKQYKSAFGYFAQALEAAPAKAKIYVNRAALYSDVDWYQKAVEDLEMALSLYGPSKVLEKKKSEALWNTGKRNKAIENWRNTLLYFNAEETDWMLLAQWQLAVGSKSDALESYRRVLNINPFYAEALLGKGALTLEQNPTDNKAKEALEMAHLLGSSQAKATLNAFLR